MPEKAEYQKRQDAGREAYLNGEPPTGESDFDDGWHAARISMLITHQGGEGEASSV